MSDNNAEETTAKVDDGILDLRPPKGSLIRQLLRLGLTFDHKDSDGETWCDYSRGVTATQLATVTEIKTWRSDGAED